MGAVGAGEGGERAGDVAQRPCRGRWRGAWGRGVGESGAEVGADSTTAARSGKLAAGPPPPSRQGTTSKAMPSCVSAGGLGTSTYLAHTPRKKNWLGGQARTN